MASSPYRERVLDHYHHPRHRRRLKAPDLIGEKDNPVCGDRVRIELRVDDEGRVLEAAFSGDGCIISMATASMLVEHVYGRSVSELRRLTQEDVLRMLGIDLGPARLHCALLPLEALHSALEASRE
ncbi:MAG TPA: iron-sulfur cluster assembly scaffold protein [Thermoflexia bacterium]|jgi:nitrogen fixation NifU-like protein|nr:iron-sulfur cluster assembly scaffold protein [Thermoflexia bacterium]